MTRVDPLRLMQLHDGELTSEETAELERQIAQDAEARGVLEGLDQLGDFVRAFADAEARTGWAAQEESELVDGVMARLADSDAGGVPAGPGPGPRAAGRQLVAPRVAAPRWIAVGGALALAAAVMLAVGLGVKRGAGTIPSAAVALAPSVGPSAGAARAPGSVAAVGAADLEPSEPPGVAIEMVDFGARSGTIFMVTSGEDSTTPVVWLVDEAPEGGARVEPL